jgi:hypothetical protein
MTTWNELKKFIKNKYKIEAEKEAFIIINFETVAGRTQRVGIRLGGNEAVGEWVAVQSPVAKYSVKNLEAACRETAEKVVGGIVLIDDTIFLSDSIPLENLDTNEIEDPILLVTIAADALELKLTGRDAN